MLDLEVKAPDEALYARVLPDPRGYKLLVMLPQLESVTEGGVIIPDASIRAEQTASIVGFVIRMGDMAYSDHAKFPTGAWCGEGDWVLFKTYSGTRILVKGTEFRLINDDAVEAVVQDPRAVSRA